MIDTLILQFRMSITIERGITMSMMARGRRVFFVMALFFCISFFLVGEGSLTRCAFAQDDAYKVISTQADLDAVMVQVRQLLIAQFALTLRLPVKGTLVSGAKLDELYGGAYRGAQIGLYRNKGTYHEIYIMIDMGKDNCLATLSHEMTHAWQMESCPANQDILVKEGFARWVEYKTLLKTGAYIPAQNLREQADPVYGVGFKKMLELEDKLGEMGLVQKVKTMRTLND
jgi:hypothetical protein